MARIAEVDVPAVRRAVMNRALLGWFEDHGRDLAFRRTGDAYAVLVAEVMLQQTQASRVGPAWERFMARFPTLSVLAGASPAQVIRAWGGLGYNGRAVRLLRAARAIAERHGGRVPRAAAVLEGLPGIGPYTARAVAATVFGLPVAAVDTNVGRVVRRVFGVGGDGPGRAAPAPSATVQRLADAWVARRRAADWTHAVMDVGATLCRPREPSCGACPLRPYCRFAAARAAEPLAEPAAGQRRRRSECRAAKSAPFPATRRWLRGRLLARLRDAHEGRWVDLSGPLGVHSAASVDEALGQLVREGLAERDRRGRVRLPGAAP